MDDCETLRDCLIDSQCEPPSSDRPDTLKLWQCIESGWLGNNATAYMYCNSAIGFTYVARIL